MLFVHGANTELNWRMIPAIPEACNSEFLNYNGNSQGTLSGYLGGVFKYCLFFHTYLSNNTYLVSMFQMCWNHQLVSRLLSIFKNQLISTTWLPRWLKEGSHTSPVKDQTNARSVALGVWFADVLRLGYTSDDMFPTCFVGHQIGPFIHDHMNHMYYLYIIQVRRNCYCDFDSMF